MRCANPASAAVELRRLCLEYNAVRRSEEPESVAAIRRWILLIRNIHNGGEQAGHGTLLWRMIAEGVSEELLEDRSGSDEVCPSTLERLLGHPSNRLVSYGTLAPGRRNNWVLQDISGTWQVGKVYGQLHARGWGAIDGYPAMTFDENGSEIPAHMFTSDYLTEHWERIDKFEGVEYERILVPFVTGAGRVVAGNIYALRDPPGSAA